MGVHNVEAACLSWGMVFGLRGCIRPVEMAANVAAQGLMSTSRLNDEHVIAEGSVYPLLQPHHPSEEGACLRLLQVSGGGAALASCVKALASYLALPQVFKLLFLLDSGGQRGCNVSKRRADS